MILSGGHDKRRRRTRAQVEQLEEQIYQVLEEDHPQSVRHVFYRMPDPRLPEPVDKKSGYSHVQNRLKLMRRAGSIPYHWITDATRRGYHVQTFDGAADFLARVRGLYRSDLWERSGHYVEVWCESRSIAGVIEHDCRELAVSLYPAGGFSSLTLAYESAEFIREATDRDDSRVPAEIIYIGDYDPAGVLIDKKIESELRLHLGPDVDLTFHRIAINPDQILEHDLPTKPRNENDLRAKHIKETVEAEAMPARLLRRLLRDKIESFLPSGELEVIKTTERAEKRTLLETARELARR
jgi:hypothetical protein